MGSSEIDCDAVLRQVELFLDRELGDAEFSRIEVHLSTCTPCMQRVEFRVALREIVRRKCSSERVPEDLLDRVRGRLREA